MSQSHSCGLIIVYLQIIYVYLMLTQWMRSVLWARQAAFLSAPVAGSLACGRRIHGEEEGPKTGRTLLYMDNRSCSWSIPNWVALYKLDSPVHMKQNTAIVHSPWIYAAVSCVLSWNFCQRLQKKIVWFSSLTHESAMQLSTQVLKFVAFMRQAWLHLTFNWQQWFPPWAEGCGPCQQLNAAFLFLTLPAV